MIKNLGIKNVAAIESVHVYDLKSMPLLGSYTKNCLDLNVALIQGYIN